MNVKVLVDRIADQGEDFLEGVPSHFDTSRRARFA